jgi:short subunit fatty acids transporter
MIALVTVSVIIAYFSAPRPDRAKTTEDFGHKFEPIDTTLEPRKKPGEWLEYSPVLIVMVAALLVWYIVDLFRNSPAGPLAALDLNNYNLLNPFRMLPLLGILKVRARDLAGYSVLQLVFHIPLVFLLCWYFSLVLPFVPPVK